MTVYECLWQSTEKYGELCGSENNHDKIGVEKCQSKSTLNDSMAHTASYATINRRKRHSIGNFAVVNAPVRQNLSHVLRRATLFPYTAILSVTTMTDQQTNSLVGETLVTLTDAASCFCLSVL
jgi:hypothetical protein